MIAELNGRQNIDVLSPEMSKHWCGVIKEGVKVMLASFLDWMKE